MQSRNVSVMREIRHAQDERLSGGVATLERPTGRLPATADWSLLSAQGRVLFYIALCSGCTTREIARALNKTERAIWGIISTLRRKGMLRIRKSGRKHFYSVELDAPLLHPTIEGLTLRPILGRIAEEARENDNEVCAES